MGELKHFADASRDSKHWTPEQCLEAALADLRSGELATVRGEVGRITQLAVHFYVKGSDGRLRPCHYIAGMDNAEYVALLALSQQKAIDDWRS